MARATRSSWEANRHLALGAIAPPRRPRAPAHAPLFSRAAQRTAGWAMLALIIIWRASVLVH